MPTAAPPMSEVRPDELQRFTYLERVVHWTVGITYVLLLLSGLAFSYPSLFWLTAIFGGGPAARVLHAWIGVLFSGAMVLMIFLWLRDMYLNRSDIQWLKSVRHYALRESDRVPPAGKYNAGQKLFYWLQGFLAVVFLATGIALWLPEGLGRDFLLTARLLHFVATIAGGLLLIVHVYLGTVAYPGTAGGMIHGRVTRAWARLHHPLWAGEKGDG